MRVYIAVLCLILPTLAYGVQTCNPGYYKPSADSECNSCPRGFYCPDDDSDEAIVCPPDTVDWTSLLRECGYHPLHEIPETLVFSWTGNRHDQFPEAWDITQCFAHVPSVDFQEGKWLLEFRFNPENGDYWHGCDELQHFYYANAGNYLANYYQTTYEDWYHNIKPCTNEHPANSHYSGPGTPDDPVKKGGRTDYNDCPWECDDGYGRHEGACLPLCTAGATTFHAGDYVFNIYADKLTTLAINIALGDTVCYVPLVPGSGKGALNVDYHGVIYHTSD